MLNDLRNQATFEPEEEEEKKPETIQPKPPKIRKPRRSFDKITGTTDKQRLMLVIMLFIMVCLVGVLLLVMTGKVVPPVTF